jgi:hypothetical protein
VLGGIGARVGVYCACALGGRRLERLVITSVAWTSRTRHEAAISIESTGETLRTVNSLCSALKRQTAVDARGESSAGALEFSRAENTSFWTLVAPHLLQLVLASQRRRVMSSTSEFQIGLGRAGFRDVTCCSSESASVTPPLAKRFIIISRSISEGELLVPGLLPG